MSVRYRLGGCKHYAFVTKHRMNNTNSKPQCQLEISVNRVYQCWFISCNKWTTLVKMLIIRKTVGHGEREYAWVHSVHKNALEKNKLCRVLRTVAMQSVVRY